MKLAIVVAPGVGRVMGLVGSVSDLRLELEDREANGVNFPGEHIVRLPRSANPPRWTRRTQDFWWPWFKASVQFARRTWGCFALEGRGV